MTMVNTATGEAQARFEYDPFGQEVRATGPALAHAKFRFSSKYFDGESDLSYYGYRFYNPDTGRWVNRDPIGEQGGVNLYGFVSNNPVNATDPLGLHQWIEGPSGSEPTAHQSFNVGDPSGQYSSYSFGTDPLYPGNWRLNGGIVLMGDVYEDFEKGGPIEKFKETTPEEDATTLERLRHMEGSSEDGYGGETCRSWSQRQFDFGPG